MSRLLDAAQAVLRGWDASIPMAALCERMERLREAAAAEEAEPAPAPGAYVRGYAAACEQAGQVAEQSARQEWLRVSQKDANEIAEVIRALQAPPPPAPGDPDWPAAGRAIAAMNAAGWRLDRLEQESGRDAWHVTFIRREGESDHYVQAEGDDAPWAIVKAATAALAPAAPGSAAPRQENETP